ncbi:phosphatidylserine/phosphatidylglycerophosphate/cardiolipin synthase family protein [Myxococcus sp. K15C18031901]|uniref:phospholipase D-like domain-containing protein n=1 Tax=Myxococcus dinghuensis TaxID=2906761 RepID=UPI0020A72391|nr:phosphatidylserine/phosphatidylglycerophosphate/cardiolipin synthase family protein [Myxococcus dinghuensis]MCP3103646.1 phosphatidylserine/phosphatidylglycerophosphate/cardiolipin synthase family protein [Myxococcus dinghuensis]
MFRRLLILFDSGSAPEQVVLAARRLCDAPEAVHLYGLVPERSELDAPPPTSLTVLDRFQEAVHAWHPATHVSQVLESHLDTADLLRAASRHGADLVVLGPLLDSSPRARVGAMLGLALRERLPVLSIGRAFERAPSAPSRMAIAVAPDGRGLGSVASFLSKCALPSELVALTTGAAPDDAHDFPALARALGIPQVLQVESLAESPLGGSAEAFDTAALRCGADLLVAPLDAVADVSALMMGVFGARALQEARVPILLLPRTQSGTAFFEERLVVSDSVVAPSLAPRFAVEQVGFLSHVSVPDMGTLTMFAEGVSLGEQPHARGIAILPSECLADAHGAQALAVSFTGPMASGALAPCYVLRPEKPLVLIDSALEEEPLEAAHALAGEAFHPVFVRMRDTESLESHRERLRERLPSLSWPHLLDASAWLDDARAEDVPRQVDGLRLLRVATRLAAAGVGICAVVTQDEQKPIHPFIRTLTPREVLDLPRDTRLEPLPVPEEPDPAARVLRFAGCTPSLEGHGVDFELDNALAREAVVAAIDAARATIHWQCYIVEDDPVTARITDAMKRAAARGVRVRFLADALYSGHDSFGDLNPALVSLARAPGVDVRAIAPLIGGPSLAELKQRNHRKLVIIDSAQAVVTGRNLGAPYYTSFDEVGLRRDSHYRDIPWLDCGARVEGPLVATLEQSFLAEWTRAGGEPFDLPAPTPRGTLRARLSLHDGLRDTHTLDTQLALIRQARARLVLVNTFPLLLELQNALVDALHRGVRVEVLFGSVRPHHGQARTYFPGGTIREVADRYVRSRLDAVIAEGGIAYEFALPPRPGWEPELERVSPHVHAKILVSDDQTVALGSANLDVTAAYWESEALLLVEDAPFARRMLTALEALFATSRRIDRSDADWRAEVEQRAWVGKNWPSLVG